MPPDFFDPKSRWTGEPLQKFSTYCMRLVIVGDSSIYKSRSLRNFIYESHKGKQVNFVRCRTEAINLFSK